MVNSLLFRWEDSQALQHHCGFCERPLSHPGARASCFGTHMEPCHRFHQAMFMRNRAHICSYCSAIDEAHYKRHHELVTQLRSIFESCGEVDWTIVPAEPEDPRRGRLSDLPPTNGEPNSHNLMFEEAPNSKRERKDAKCLARAASRAKVATQEEIRYVDSVLHSIDVVSAGNGAGPANLEEMQLIEEQLRYNANVYNSRSSRQEIRNLAKIPDVDVDFDAEMERVLDTFHITELVKRNLRNRGLQGKELKRFEVLVETLKNAVVEDLVLVKKDMMVIKMRRAGYLRYTNKTAYSIVEDRYTEEDWKTGERITSSSSESSGFTSPSEDPITPQSEALELPLFPVRSHTQSPDHRHLQHVHTRVSGDDGLGQKLIEPYHAPLLPFTMNSTPNRPAILQLKVIENKRNGIPAGETNRGWIRRDVARQDSPSLPSPTPIVEKPSISPPPAATSAPMEGSERVDRPANQSAASRPLPSAAAEVPASVNKDIVSSLALESKTAAGRNTKVKLLASVAGGAWKPSYAKLGSTAPAVQAPSGAITANFQGPECALTPDDTAADTHPIVSQKKAKKVQREAKRKAMKRSLSRKTSSPTAVEEPSNEEAVLTSDTNTTDVANTMEEMLPNASISPMGGLVNNYKVDQDVFDNVAVENRAVLPDLPTSAPSTAFPRTSHGKHDHWVRFTRIFLVDQLTAPLLQSFEGCTHGSSCRFESQEVPDCPFHEPHCPCGDPLRNQCYLMHPGIQLCTSGPYNRAQGEHLMDLYEQHERTKGRLMLVDDDLVPYFMEINTSPAKPDPASMPPRLSREHADFTAGYDRGPLMKQEVQFERLMVKNMVMKYPLNTHILQDIQSKHHGRKGSLALCYCRTEVARDVSPVMDEFKKGWVWCSYVECEFGGLLHKRCVKKLGVEKVSRWYCTSCEKQMKVVACKALNVPYIDEDDIMGHSIGQIRAGLQKMYG